MADDSTYVKGTIKIKNIEGKLVPFYPHTDSSLVKDPETDSTLKTKLTTMAASASAVANASSIKERYSDADSDDCMDDCGLETMLVAWQQDRRGFSIVVDTSSTNGYTAVPFIMYNRNGTMTVDWGDGNKEQITSGNWTSAIHRYSIPGTYNVSVKHTNWNETRMLTDYYNRYCQYSYNNYSSYTRTSMLLYYSHSVKEILSPLPPFAGTEYLSSYSSTSTTYASASSMPRNMFTYCQKLQSVPDNLFINFPDITTFEYCFWYCTALKNIPMNLFASNLNVVSFNGCFYYCTSLSQNSQISLRIGSPSVTDIGSMTYETNVNRWILYVPKNSQTYTTLVNNFSGGQVIGE